MREVGTFRPHDSTVCLKSSRSSARWIASMSRADQLDAELGEDPRLLELAREVQRGAAAHRRQQRVGALARAARALTPSTSSGSRYVRSAKPGSVMIVAGFELTTIVRKPSSRSTFSAWQPA